MKNYFLVIIGLIVSISLLGQENNAISCGDGIDNDGDGFIDCLDSDCANLPNNGCSTCTEGISFADILIEYIPGCPLADPDPTGAIGVSDWTGTNLDEPEFVFLGQGGSLKLGFTNNLLTNSGNDNPDLWVFEVGSSVESSNLELKPSNTFTENQLLLSGIPDLDSDGYYEFGNISGSTSSLDIDAIIPGYAGGELKFNAVKIVDVDGNCTGTGTPGADIDAVCALSTVACSVPITQLTEEICEGNIYEGYSTTGIYIDTLLAVSGCDSIRIIDLTVNALPNGSFTIVNDTVFVTDGVFDLQGGLPSGGVYTGIGVDSILGEFDPTIGIGTYEITYTLTDAFGCSSIYLDSITVVQMTSVVSITPDNSIVTSPNPFSGKIKIKFQNLYGMEVGITIFDLKGRPIYYSHQKIIDEDFEINLQNCHSGVYIIRYEIEGKFYSTKIIKE